MRYYGILIIIFVNSKHYVNAFSYNNLQVKDIIFFAQLLRSHETAASRIEPTNN